MKKFHTIFAGIASGIVLIALIWGFVLVGSPVTGRQERFDARRLQDLQMIQNEITNIVSPVYDKGTLLRADPLPSSLEDVLARAQYSRPGIRDPETDEPYEYRTTDERSYELCAVFTTVRSEPYDVRWNHDAGRTCFRFDLRNVDNQGPETPARAVNPVEKPLPPERQPANEGEFCGGIAGFPCAEGLDCILDGTYPDAGGTCVSQ